jgi:hypothetical protein
MDHDQAKGMPSLDVVFIGITVSSTRNGRKALDGVVNELTSIGMEKNTDKTPPFTPMRGIGGDSSQV